MEKTLQEVLITELLDPRSSASPREIAAREEILWLRSRLAADEVFESWKYIPLEKAETTAWSNGRGKKSK